MAGVAQQQGDCARCPPSQRLCRSSLSSSPPESRRAGEEDRATQRIPGKPAALVCRNRERAEVRPSEPVGIRPGWEWPRDASRPGKVPLAEKFVAKTTEIRDGGRPHGDFVGDHEIGVFRHEGQFYAY